MAAVVEPGTDGTQQGPTTNRVKRKIVEQPSRADKAFNRVTMTSGLFVLALLTMVGIFLLLQSRRAIDSQGAAEFLTRTEWRTDVQPPRIGVAGLLGGTIFVSIVAVVLAIPVSICASLFITEVAGPRARKVLTGFVDLLAAIPALLFGIWGFLFLTPVLVPVARWLTDHLGFIPFFATEEGADLTGSIFIAGVVISLMVVPILMAVMREVFSFAPVGEKEAALALGGTRSGMIRRVVLPYGRGGIVGGSMLGLGRALGETIACVLLLPQVPQSLAQSTMILQNGGATVSGFIAGRAGGDDFTVSGLMAAGLVLFLITLGVNLVASLVVAKSRSGAGVDL